MLEWSVVTICKLVVEQPARDELDSLLPVHNIPIISDSIQQHLSNIRHPPPPFCSIIYFTQLVLPPFFFLQGFNISAYFWTVWGSLGYHFECTEFSKNLTFSLYVYGICIFRRFRKSSIFCCVFNNIRFAETHKFRWLQTGVEIWIVSVSFKIRYHPN